MASTTTSTRWNATLKGETEHRDGKMEINIDNNESQQNTIETVIYHINIKKLNKATYNNYIDFQVMNNTPPPQKKNTITTTWQQSPDND